jgi:hypothetical protein
MSPGRIVLLISGTLLALLGFGVALGGGVLVWAHAFDRDAEGYYRSPTYRLAGDGYAVVGEHIDLGAAPGDWAPWSDDIDVRLRVQSADDAVFVGIAEQDALDAYLAGVPHSVVTRLGASRTDVSVRDEPGVTAPADPASADIWVAQAAGAGVQELDWTVQPGTWAVAVLNADASPGVAVDAQAAASSALLLPLGGGMLLIGVLLLAVAAVLVVVATAAGMSRAGAPGPAASARAGRYPLALSGRLDEPLSRWMWLVKWLLLLPHYLVLALLVPVFVILTIVAGVAILLTGRYPRAVFDFNVGVLRWTWRVAFYGYSALGTDRYPPFTLDSADYPADLQVAYPARLSRGLVLVKWWLLVLPHYLIVAVLAGGALSWTFQDGPRSWNVSLGGGVIGVLVVVAGLLLLVRAAYPRGLFDLVMGLNRWVYRVIAYAALLTDEYPPFRLDPGGPEPPPPLPPAPGPADTTGMARPLEPSV